MSFSMLDRSGAAEAKDEAAAVVGKDESLIDPNSGDSLRSSQRDDEESELISYLCVGLSTLNFQRKPISLVEEKLTLLEYSEYRYAVLRIPEHRLLRERLIGYVVHSTPQQWNEDMTALLASNVNQSDDPPRWIRSGDVEP